MALNLTTSPYHDDYDETKQFYRILFRPGRAVQARELTQIQTSLQNQIKRFGQNIFKEGALVLPGHSAIDLYAKYVKLTTSYNSVDSDDVLASLVGVEITGQTSGIRALVIDYELSSSADSPTLYVKYLDSGTSKTATNFADDEVLVNADSSVSVKAAVSNATGTGIRFSIQSGVLFVKGVFAYFDSQDIIVSKYDNTVSKSVGFLITESVITSDEDESLLDPASGSYNYFAPGADRYKIALDLNVRNIGDYTNDPDFVELARIENGVLISLKKTTEYNILNDTLARRTYEESGNYNVRPYSLEVTNHLRSSNSALRDGLYTTVQGGNTDLYVGIVSPGKSYVLGYEVENTQTRYVNIPKARDYVSVNQGFIPTEVGNYVLITSANSVPDIATHSTISLYNRLTTTPGSLAGSLVGTARPRALEYYSGSGSSSVFKLYLFDLQMVSPYTFERNVKQIYYDNSGFGDFTANIVPDLITLTGTVSTTNGSSTVTGAGTRFNSELAANNFISINGNVSEVVSITSDYQLTVLNNVVGNISGFSAYRLDANIVLPEKNSYLFELPYSTIKTVDPTDIETTYYSRRVYDRTLSSGSVSITAGTNEIFTSYSADDYIVINKSTGVVVPLYSANISLGGSPTGKTITLALGSSYGTNDVRFFTTVAKSNNAADKKVKTLTSTYLDFTSNTTATSTLNLARADVYQVSNVLMSSNVFGSTFIISESRDITSRYSLDNGQRRTHYDIAKLKLKPGQPAPTGPVRVYYNYFAHSAGDYCSVDSYADLDYKDIPSFKDGSKIFNLRDCLDFRPVIDTNGTTFTNPTEFLNQSVLFTTDYEYYLGKIDKIVVNPTGNLSYVSGPSSLTPTEPATPENTMALYVLKQKPYVFDVKTDIDVSIVDNKRYTMRDIGRIENRVKNLEYYTELSLLELDQKVFTIKDNEGFDRFKNGFVVDNFTGHNVGDPTHPDYSISMDINAGEIRPLFVQTNLPLTEIATTSSQRTSNNYTLTGNIASLPYTAELFIESNVASRVENINPFEVIKNIGTLTLNPPADYWFETIKLPDVLINQEQTLSTLQPDSTGKGTYNSLWNGWELAWVGSRRQEQRTGTNYNSYEKIDTVTNNDVTVSKVIIPKMRSVNIKFTATGMKANTKLRAFFDGYDVTNFCYGEYTSTGTLMSDSTVPIRANDIINAFVTNYGNIITDVNGTVTGVFNYQSTYFNLNVGEKKFILTDSPTSSEDSETVAEAIFLASGETRQIRNDIVSTRVAGSAQEVVYENRPAATAAEDPVATPITQYLPAQTVVYDAILGNNNDWNSLDDKTNAVKSATGLPTGLEGVRELSRNDEIIQENLQAATTGAEAAAVKSTAVSYFNDDGSVKWDVLSPALYDNSWSSGLTTSADQLKATKDAFYNNIKSASTSLFDGSFKPPAEGSILGDMLEALDSGYAPLQNFINGNPNMSKEELAIHLTASLMTVAGAASQDSGSLPDAKWKDMMDNIVSGNQLPRLG